MNKLAAVEAQSDWDERHRRGGRRRAVARALPRGCAADDHLGPDHADCDRGGGGCHRLPGFPKRRQRRRGNRRDLTLPKGARVVASSLTDDRLAVTLDIGADRDPHLRPQDAERNRADQVRHCAVTGRRARSGRVMPDFRASDSAFHVAVPKSTMCSSLQARSDRSAYRRPTSCSSRSGSCRGRCGAGRGDAPPAGQRLNHEGSFIRAP